jgi:hypothetical protein
MTKAAWLVTATDEKKDTMYKPSAYTIFEAPNEPVLSTFRQPFVNLLSTLCQPSVNRHFRASFP